MLLQIFFDFLSFGVCNRRISLNPSPLGASRPCSISKTTYLFLTKQLLGNYGYFQGITMQVLFADFDMNYILRLQID